MREHHHGRGGGPVGDALGDPRFGERRFGARGGWGPGGPGGRGRRVRRGDIRPLLLTTLLDGPAHGYELIRRLEERSGGMWKPSPGSVYPTLQLLADEDMVTSTEADGKRIFALTDRGRAEAQAHQASGGPEPWDGDPSAQSRFALREAMAQLHHAAQQVGSAGGSDEVDKAVEIVRQARQSLYKILAEA
jgi:DNA-binding PadR family transcriptional regulator